MDLRERRLQLESELTKRTHGNVNDTVFVGSSRYDIARDGNAEDTVRKGTLYLNFFFSNLT